MVFKCSTTYVLSRWEGWKWDEAGGSSEALTLSVQCYCVALYLYNSLCHAGSLFLELRVLSLPFCCMSIYRVGWPSTSTLFITPPSTHARETQDSPTICIKTIGNVKSIENIRSFKAVLNSVLFLTTNHDYLYLKILFVVTKPQSSPTSSQL